MEVVHQIPQSITVMACSHRRHGQVVLTTYKLTTYKYNRWIPSLFAQRITLLLVLQIHSI